MYEKSLKFTLSISTMALLLFFSGVALAQDPPSECVQTGALAWDNWTKDDSGGSDTLPDGETNKDYLRCKACHGWDAQGTDGGYVRRSRKETRPNAGAGDGDTTARALTRGSITEAMVAHDGTGRAFSEGTGSWVELNDMGMHQSNNKAQHSNGFTLGNQHPDFSGGDMTEEQIGCLTEFLNFMDADHSTYFANIDPSQDPVLYTMVDTADADAGETFYGANCFGCHGDPATDHQGGNGGAPDGGLLAYLANDGKFSEFSHKARWGIPGTIMTHSTMGSPTSANVTDMMLYLQELGGTGFAINPGLSGNWWGGAARDGEGFLVDVSHNLNDDTIIIVSFYTYDSDGNQVWLIGAGPIDGNTAEIAMTIPDSAMWGADFDPADIPDPRPPWGTGTFTFTSCGAGSIALVPNAEMQIEGFTDLAYDINRSILIPGVACPTPAN
jgi:mono/diheme cytochrome c family protein